VKIVRDCKNEFLTSNLRKFVFGWYPYNFPSFLLNPAPTFFLFSEGFERYYGNKYVRDFRITPYYSCLNGTEPEEKEAARRR
jgi:hypothetical protein